MNASNEILMAKSNHIFAWPFEFKVEEKNVENFAEPFEKEAGYGKK